MRREIKRIVSILTITAALGLSIAAQPEPVCSKYYAVGSRTCVIPTALTSDSRGGTLTTAGGRTEDTTAADGGGTLGNGNAVGGNGQLGSGNATAGGGGLGSGSFWDWVTSIF